MAIAAIVTLMLGAQAVHAEPALQQPLQQLQPASAHIAPLAVDFHGETASPEARAAARAAFEGFDAKGRPFAVVDKKEAKLFVFNADGQLVGAAPALLGLARGDTVAPGVGQMVSTGIPPSLRTTPSGRYDSQPGPNLKGETVIWVDYDAAFAIHRLRPSPAYERRAERLASPSPDDNRISLGCVVVAGEFFDRVVAPVLGHGPGVVYVLPEPGPAAVAQNTATGRL
ncbi:L,D-transpeptidase [Roseateles chitinivorans]|uniref:L,D-transpeptidase n=1 Tax=Roseateles chitinivorans TaxID=2917965 RepID=UPI003D6795E9